MSSLGPDCADPRLCNWIARDAVDSGRSPGVTGDEHRELVEARRRIRVLEMEMENEILKRASAYFARENVLPKSGFGWSRSSPRTVSPTTSSVPRLAGAVGAG